MLHQHGMIREKYALLNQHQKRCKMIKHVQPDFSIDVRFKFGAATECGGEEATLTIADPKKFPSEISTQHFAQGKLARGGAGFAQKVLIEAFNSTEKLGVIKRCGSCLKRRLKPYTINLCWLNTSGSKVGHISALELEYSPALYVCVQDSPPCDCRLPGAECHRKGGTNRHRPGAHFVRAQKGLKMDEDVCESEKSIDIYSTKRILRIPLTC